MSIKTRKTNTLSWILIEDNLLGFSFLEKKVGMTSDEVEKYSNHPKSISATKKV